jgi:hypothetical protein
MNRFARVAIRASTECKKPASAISRNRNPLPKSSVRYVEFVFQMPKHNPLKAFAALNDFVVTCRTHPLRLWRKILKQRVILSAAEGVAYTVRRCQRSIVGRSKLAGVRDLRAPSVTTGEELRAGRLPEGRC